MATKEKKKHKGFLSLVTSPSGFSDNLLHLVDLGLGTSNGTELLEKLLARFRF
jgi:hypothetical protein